MNVGATHIPDVRGQIPEAGAANRALASNSAEKADDDGFSFLDFIDIINPLHHIPVIGTLYREITGDEIDSTARLIGGGIFGGIIGLAIAGVDVISEETTGKDVGEHVLAVLGIDDDEQESDVAPRALAEAGSGDASAGDRFANEGPARATLAGSRPVTAADYVHKAPDAIPTMSPEAMAALFSSLNLAPPKELTAPRGAARQSARYGEEDDSRSEAATGLAERLQYEQALKLIEAQMQSQATAGAIN